MATTAGLGLFGRDAECERLMTLLSDDRPVLVTGEAGVGKTSLVRAAASGTARGLYEGRGFATLADLPYAALRQAVRGDLAGDTEAVAAHVEHVVGPDVLFVDDLQWVDPDSLAVVRMLAGRVGLVVASRDASDGPDANGTTTWERLDLSPLVAEAAAMLARRLHPDATPSEIARILAGAGGNPLLIEELIRDGVVSPTIRRAIGSRLQGASPAARDAAGLLAILDVPVPASALGSPASELVHLGLARQAGAGLMIRHDLLRETILAEIDADARSGLHRRAAGLAVDPVVAAEHLLLAGDHGAAEEVARRSLDGAVDPRWRARLLEVVARSSDGPGAWDAQLRAALAYRDVGDETGVIRALESSAPPDMEGRAWQAALLVDAFRMTGRPREAEEIRGRAQGLLIEAPSDGWLELAGTEAIMLTFDGRVDHALALLDAVLAVGGDLATARRTRSVRATLGLFAGQPGAVDLLEAIWREAAMAGDNGMAGAMAINLQTGLFLERSAHEALRFAVDEADRLEAAGLASRAIELRAATVQTAVFAGELDEAIRLSDGVLEAPSLATDTMLATFNGALARALAGAHEPAARMLARLEDSSPAADLLGLVLSARAQAAYWGGQPAAAADLATDAIEARVPSPSNRVLPGLVRGWALLDLGRRQEPFPEVPPLRILAGAVPEAAGIMALAAGDAAAAIRSFDAAAALWAGFHTPQELICSWAAGEAARRAERLDAADRLHAVLDRAETIGFVPLAARARRSLRLAGVHAIAPPVAHSPQGTLTPREREVLAHVGAGLSNIEIARRMGLGRPTVARALSSAMSKLGVDSRAQAVVRGGIT